MSGISDVVVVFHKAKTERLKMELENDILQLIRDQSIINQQLANLQKEANRLQTQMTDVTGQLKAYFKIYQQENGNDFNQAMNADKQLMDKVWAAQEEGKRIASGAQPQNTMGETNASALQPNGPTQTTTQAQSAPQAVSPKPGLRKVQGNKIVPIKSEELDTVVRTREPVKISVDDDPPMPTDAPDEE